MTCCAFGPCENSTANGGKGCYLCDVVAHLPQPSSRREATLTAETSNEKKKGAKQLKTVAAGKSKGRTLW